MPRIAHRAVRISPDGPGTPGPGAHDASARASRRATAAFIGGRTGRRHCAPGGYPRTAPVRGCEPRPRVPRPAPLRTTPRPKRPSVDGTACTNSESHPRCQGAAHFVHIVFISAHDPTDPQREFACANDAAITPNGKSQHTRQNTTSLGVNS